MAKPQEKQELIDLTSLPLPTLKQVRSQLDEVILVNIDLSLFNNFY
jgi:hypothetical protein